MTISPHCYFFSIIVNMILLEAQSILKLTLNKTNNLLKLLKNIKLKVRIKMSDTKEKTKIQEINWVIIGIWIILLIATWLIFWVNAPNMALFIIAIAITIAGPALNYGLLWYKTSKTNKN